MDESMEYFAGVLSFGEEQPFERGVSRVGKGIPYRKDRLKALGNAIVPQVAMEIFKLIKVVEWEAR